jgi:putative (di)nucleoside polyphosphate hydrolase
MRTTTCPTTYRPCVGIALFNNDNKVFIGQRCQPVSDHWQLPQASSAQHLHPNKAALPTNDPFWQMPQGGIDDGESVEAAAFRELVEETSITQAALLGILPDWYCYDLPDDLRKTLWGGKYKGQCQRWIALRFLGDDGQVNLATAHPEFRTWRWEEPAAVPALTVPFKQALYAQLIPALKGLL